MNRFLKYIAVFSASLLLLAAGIEYMLRQVPNPIRFKRQLIETHQSDIKTLIIGSSVVNCGIDPASYADSTYNLAISGEWMRFNQALFEKYVDSLPQLKDLIWGLCFHALWMDDAADVDESSLINHKIYMDISREDDYFHQLELPYLGALSMRKWSKYYIRRKSTITCDSQGLDHDYALALKEKDWLEEIPDMVRDQHKTMLADKDSTLYRANVRRLHEVARLCHERGIRLHLVMPPVHPEYVRLADRRQWEMIRTAAESVVRQWDNVTWHDYLSDPRFTDDDFYDGNHLSSDHGAVKFTRILRQDLQQDLP